MASTTCVDPWMLDVAQGEFDGVVVSHDGEVQGDHIGQDNDTTTYYVKPLQHDALCTYVPSVKLACNEGEIATPSSSNHSSDPSSLLITTTTESADSNWPSTPSPSSVTSHSSFSDIFKHTCLSGPPHPASEADAASGQLATTTVEPTIPISTNFSRPYDPLNVRKMPTVLRRSQHTCPRLQISGARLGQDVRHGMSPAPRSQPIPIPQRRTLRPRGVTSSLESPFTTPPARVLSSSKPFDFGFDFDFGGQHVGPTCSPMGPMLASSPVPSVHTPVLYQLSPPPRRDALVQPRSTKVGRGLSIKDLICDAEEMPGRIDKAKVNVGDVSVGITLEPASLLTKLMPMCRGSGVRRKDGEVKVLIKVKKGQKLNVVVESG